MLSPCVIRPHPVALVHCPLNTEIAMNHKQRHPQQQATLPLSRDIHWIELPADVREPCRALLVELLIKLARCPATGGDDER
jgi:hypothetical protein